MVVGDFPLSGKIAVVTGGGSGINLSFVKLALASQAKVLIADIQLLQEAQDLIRGPDTAGRVAYAKCDVCKWEQLERLPSEVENAFGPGAVADVWVAGAGVFESNATCSSFFLDNEDDGYKAMRINAEHPIKLTRIAMRSCLKANKPGVVLIVASCAGVTGFYSSPLYCATKHAVVGFTKSMAQADKDENFKVVSVCPGIVSTPMWTAARDVAKQYAYSDEMAITAEEVAEAMKNLIEQGRFSGGSLLEASKSRGRNLLESSELSQKLGPEGQPWIDGCYAPVRRILEEERAASRVD